MINLLNYMKKPLEEVVKTGLESKFRFVQKFKKFVYLLAVSSMVYSCTLSEKEPELELLLNANNQTVRKGDEVSLTLDEKNQSPYVNSYVLNIDYKKDGIIDETLTSENPININRKFEYEGNNAVYGKLISNSGKIYENSLEIKVLPKDSPVLIFSTDANELRKGEYANFKVSVSDLNGDIDSYFLAFDENADGSIEETLTGEVSSLNPIEVNKKFYCDKLRVYSKVTDKTNLEDAYENLIDLKEDLKLEAVFQKDYTLGGFFTYLINLVNINPQGKKVILDNSDHNSFSYNLFNGEKSIFGFNLDQDLIINFLKGGVMSVESQETKTKFGIDEKCSALWQGIPFWIDGPFSLSYSLGATPLTKAGEYYLEETIKYKVEGEDKEHKIYLQTPKITVK